MGEREGVYISMCVFPERKVRTTELKSWPWPCASILSATKDGPDPGGWMHTALMETQVSKMFLCKATLSPVLGFLLQSPGEGQESLWYSHCSGTR